jgi:hypothetical protein
MDDLYYRQCRRCGGRGEYYWDTGCDCCSGYDTCDACDGLGMIIEPWQEWSNVIYLVCECCGFWYGYGFVNLDKNPDEIKCINCGHVNPRPTESPRNYWFRNDKNPWLTTSDVEEYLWEKENV